MKLKKNQIQWKAKDEGALKAGCTHNSRICLTTMELWTTSVNTHGCVFLKIMWTRSVRRGKIWEKANILCSSVFQTCFACWPFLASKNNNGSSRPCSSISCPDDRYPILDIYISELILDRYEYIPAEYVIMHCMIWRCLNRLPLASWVQWVS